MSIGDSVLVPLWHLTFLKFNMEGLFGSKWSTEEKMCRNMMASEACYTFFHKAPNSSVDKMSIKLDKSPLVGFVNYRFTLEEEIHVLYMYEYSSSLVSKGKD